MNQSYKDLKARRHDLGLNGTETNNILLTQEHDIFI